MQDFEANDQGLQGALREELEQTKSFAAEMESKVEEAQKALQAEIERAESRKSTEDSQANEAQRSLQVELEGAEERASYWEAMSKQQAAQHSEHISQLCEEMKNIMLEEKAILQQEFEQETEKLREKLFSELSLEKE